MMERRLLPHMRPIVGAGESAPGLDEFRAPLPHHHCGLRWPWRYDRLEERRSDRFAIIVKERPTQPWQVRCRLGFSQAASHPAPSIAHGRMGEKLPGAQRNMILRA
jgi:hypothetical protein